MGFQHPLVLGLIAGSAGTAFAFGSGLLESKEGMLRVIWQEKVVQRIPHSLLINFLQGYSIVIAAISVVALLTAYYDKEIDMSEKRRSYVTYYAIPTLAASSILAGILEIWKRTRIQCT